MIKKQFLLLAAAVGFILGIRNGYIALWNQGERQPVKVFPYQVASLPPADQAALKRGIIIKEKSELQEILQDYLS